MSNSGRTSNNSGGGGIGFAGLLTILFIGLKLTNHIDWSWWWVLSPMWISVGLFIVILFCIGIVVSVTKGLRNYRK